MTDKKSGRKSGNRPGTFTGKGDPRNGRGPKAGAPNAGRPKDQVRAGLALDFESNRPILDYFAKGEEFTPEQRMKAIELQARYGLGTQQEVEQDREVTIRVVRDEPLVEKMPSPERSEGGGQHIPW